MEELQSTEILDREILDDARKKAMRILKQAEDTIKAQNTEWEKKIEDCVNDLNKKYSEQEKHEVEKVMSRLPIDKLRLKIEKIENILVSAEDNWYESIERKFILQMLSNELGMRLKFISEQMPDIEAKKAMIYMIEKKEAEELLKNFNINCGIEEIHSASRYPLITIETDKVLITASIQRVIDYFLHVKRTELFEALVGRGFMENI